MGIRVTILTVLPVLHCLRGDAFVSSCVCGLIIIITVCEFIGEYRQTDMCVLQGGRVPLTTEFPATFRNPCNRTYTSAVCLSVVKVREARGTAPYSHLNPLQ